MAAPSPSASGTGWYGTPLLKRGKSPRCGPSKIMAKLPNEISETIWSLKRQLAEVIETAKATEFALFDTFGENERTDTYLTDLQSVAEQATDRFSQLTTLQIRIFNAQPQISNDMLDFIRQVIIKTEARLPALEQSIQEIKIEWKL
jgi:hypothetical protein